MTQAVSRQQALFLLVLAAIATIATWQLPFGHQLLYPFTILSVWFHEMGHGLTALVLGGSFQKLELFANGSGVATHGGAVFGGRLGRALVAAGGPLGPAIAGSGLIIAARWPNLSRWNLGILVVALLLSLIWMRTLFGVIAIVGWAAGIGGIAAWGPRWLREFALPFLGVQACVSTYNQLSYLFTRAVQIDGQFLLSDSGQIARQLFLPYWFWGALLGLLSLGLLAISLLLTYGDDDEIEVSSDDDLVW
ncbi:MAG: M50 family metallopeptidase [Cyanobacteria bacterium P01_G01_bin.4]